jgi:50S ribosomal protein L16 3-hydroxylase
MKKYTVLGGLSPQKFLRTYWHKQPLLIRQAIPGFAPLLSRDALFGLAADPQVETRLVAHDAGRWSFEHGPFKRLPSLRKKNWTALVQGVNLHDDKAAALLDQFRFVPDTRLDDLMISYATDGGGVGPHFDSYDVFLLQAQGKRRWRISAQQDLALVEGLPLKILNNFVPEQEFVLEPGDMLYLPPHYAHDGVAVGECMTYSIGFRAPSYQELGEAFLQFMAESIELPGRYADPDLRPSKRPAEIQDAMLEKVAGAIRSIAFDDDDIAIFLGEYLSEPKPSVVFVPPARPLTPARFLATACRRGVKPARQTRLLYRGRHLFINGESFELRGVDRMALRTLADLRRLDASEVAAASNDIQEALHTWYQDGWLLIG